MATPSYLSIYRNNDRFRNNNHPPIDNQQTEMKMSVVKVTFLFCCMTV